MLFRRRTKPHFWEVVRVSVWPRRTWRRSISYIAKRVLRLSASPHAIAAGFAAGAMVSFTPFMGLHFILAAALAWLIGGNVLASALGTFVGNPLTFPFIWAGTYELGKWVLGGEGRSPRIDLSGGIFNQSLDALWPLIKPMTVGGLILGVIAWFALYFPIRAIATATKRRRHEYFAGLSLERKRAREALEETKTPPPGAPVVLARETQGKGDAK
ncbi:MAG: DUF2062 domain-containing protein [Flavobacteriaceae bacterium]